MRKRPEGWVPPGPEVPGGVEAEEGETLDCLSGNFRIFQLKSGHRYSTDDLLTAWYLSEKAGEGEVKSHLDLGTGIGSVAMLVAWLFPNAALTGIEAQGASARLAQKSARYNGILERFRVVAGDFREEIHGISPASFRTATGSPPYFLHGEGKKSTLPQRGPCRFEERGGAREYLMAAARYLLPGGLFVWVNIDRNREKNLAAAMEAGFGAITVKPVAFAEGNEPLIALFSARPGGEGSVAEEKILTVRLKSGGFTPEYAEIRRKMGFPA